MGSGLQKTRRRVEDLLRKGAAGNVYRTAALLGIGCSEHGGHEYASHNCPNCRAEFCYACCGGQNVDQGGKYDEADYMLCPVCWHNIYE
ncbi:hypothetical protein C4588_06270 [Candidatus Parcubacteria bacterium]|nr:MAG: hypothetical protein C4588_06270 [Candidatus Parcubacteria bacterium]